jgi:hypothetical protein
MSADARKVVQTLEKYGVEVEDTFDVELAVNDFYPNHITGVIDSIMKKANGKSLMRAQDQGWDYFRKPVYSLLTSRPAAKRPDSVGVNDDGDTRRIYALIASGYCLADFNQTEARLVFGLTNYERVLSGIGAAKRQGQRSIYYLNGIVQREAATAAGKLREAQAQNSEAEAKAWSPPQDYEKLDAGELAIVELDWRDKLTQAEWDNHFNNGFTCKD